MRTWDISHDLDVDLNKIDKICRSSRRTHNSWECHYDIVRGHSSEESTGSWRPGTLTMPIHSREGTHDYLGIACPLNHRPRVPWSRSGQQRGLGFPGPLPPMTTLLSPSWPQTPGDPMSGDQSRANPSWEGVSTAPSVAFSCQLR
jgi:hypothetical protein